MKASRTPTIKDMKKKIGGITFYKFYDYMKNHSFCKILCMIYAY